MRRLQDISIAHKLVLMILSVTFVSLAAGFSAITLLELRGARRDLRLDAALRARMAAEYSVADLAFGYREAAAATLTKLVVYGDIDSAALYDPGGALFAGYTRAGLPPGEISAAHGPGTAPSGGRFLAGRLEVCEPAVYKGARYGTLCLSVSTGQHLLRIKSRMKILAALALCVALLAFLIASRLQGLVSRPVMRLAELAREVSKEENYSLRTGLGGRGDEIGVMAEGFDSMLAGLEERRLERDTAEASLRKSEATFRKIIEQSPVSMAIVGLDGTIEYINKKAVETFGYSPEDVPDMDRWWRLAYPDEKYRGEVMASWGGRVEEALRKKREIEGGEYRVTCRDGSVKTVFIFGVPVENKVFVMFEDITARKRADDEIRELNAGLEKRVEERTSQLAATNEKLLAEVASHKKTEEALANARDYFSKIINSVADPIFVKDREHRWVLINDAFCGFIGHSRGELLGKSDYEFFPKEEADVFREKDELVFTTGAENLNEEKITDAGGVTHTIATKKVLHRAADGQESIVGVIRDITVRKRTEEEVSRLNLELKGAVEKLTAANNELDAFSYSVSHDLKAPLRALEGFSRIISEDYGEKLDEKGRHALDVIGANAKRMGQLIDDLLEFAHLGRREITARPVDMNEIAQAVSGELRERMPESRDVRLEIKDLRPAKADPALLRQVWVNFLSNAIKFTGTKKTARIEVGCEAGDGENVYYVKDNGAGFDMRYADKLFGVFQRLHGKSEFEGTGVGLAIAQRIIAKHGGRVWAEGKVGEGAAFYFTLPKGDGDGKR